jgi:preprotein translocase subunit YajC
LQWGDPSLYSAQTFDQEIFPVFITPAYAQAAGAPGAGDFIGMILPLVLIMGVFYFLLIRPQQRKMKEHQDMLSKVGKGDTVITTGGLIGKVVKVVDDAELQVEIGENIRVRVLRTGIANVRAKGEPVKAEAK